MHITIAGRQSTLQQLEGRQQRAWRMRKLMMLLTSLPMGLASSLGVSGWSYPCVDR